MFKEIKIETTKRNELIDITSQVEEIVNSSGINTGICLVYVPTQRSG